MSSPASDRLNVIALISGGKDSFYSILHCLENGHRVVALANLYPAPGDTTITAGSSGSAPYSAQTTIIRPEDSLSVPGGGHGSRSDQHDADRHVRHEPGAGDSDEVDLNSFMYQTVGHQIIPQYAAATGLPLYRQPIAGGARDESRDYDGHHAALSSGSHGGVGQEDETESMLPLLRTVMAHHPEANAVCAGAILSTYQRTRVESVALRLGLTPLAYLWKYPVLPPIGPGIPADDAQLLLDMAAAGLDARIIKVASAGLDEGFLWERVSSLQGVTKVKRALKRFGAAEGSVLGEGGEFETIVVDGPGSLFRKRISVSEDQRTVVREGGGTAWLNIQGAAAEDVDVSEDDVVQVMSGVRVPGVLDPRFQSITTSLSGDSGNLSVDRRVVLSADKVDHPQKQLRHVQESLWTVSVQDASALSIQDETSRLVEQIESLLQDSPGGPLPTTAITNTVIVLRRMSDFPAINSVYGGLFKHPNPPSRVTISCGDLLPKDCNILIYLTVRPDVGPADRKGLHVQSRSYWAPANIGPYSQSIDVPLFSTSAERVDDDEDSLPGSARLLSIAGQIPLWPASMNIPASADMRDQIVMSLQHLWRIGLDQKVQLWSSAVAYFPRAATIDEMRRNAGTAAQAWKLAHSFGVSDDEDEDAGPDVWDRKYNSQYMTFGADNGALAAAPKLPEWSVVRTPLDDDDVDEDGAAGIPPPPFFAVEVAELPRQSGVEWHAHAGLSGLTDASVQTSTATVGPATGGDVDGPTVSHLSVHGIAVRSVVAIPTLSGGGQDERQPLEKAVAAVREVCASTLPNSKGNVDGAPCLLYIDCSRYEFPQGQTSAVIPCRSIWSAQGNRLDVVATFSHT